MSELEKVAIRLDEADKLRVVALTPHVGKLVTYYKNGWRFAKLVEVTPTVATLQRNGSNKFEVPTADVKGLDA